jgi:hypothetical protein
LLTRGAKTCQLKWEITNIFHANLEENLFQETKKKMFQETKNKCFKKLKRTPDKAPAETINGELQMH